MPARLTAIPFTKDDLDAVADFHCGDDPWAEYVTNWIRGAQNGVLDAFDLGTDVWLYLDDDNNIVGFGSLGITEWSYPNPYQGQRVLLNVIPAYAVQSRFHKQPPGDWSQHYSSEILNDLIAEASRRCVEDSSLDPLLGLFVDERNERAIRHYENHGFKKYAKPIKGRGQRMLLNLPVAATNQGMSSIVIRQEQHTNEDISSDNVIEGDHLSGFLEAVSMVLNAPPTLEQREKKAAAKARGDERKR
jgi:hypothetical protein